MIQVYAPGNNNFTTNGDTVLMPAECLISAELNGAWTLDLVHPLDEEGRWKSIEVNAVIKAPSFNGEQLWRVRQVEKADSGITAHAEPIFMDSIGDCFLLDVRPKNKNGQEVLDIILSGNSKYSGKSDIADRYTAYFIRKNAMEAIASSEDNSFLNRWGGEILFNNFEITINKKIGGDYGYQIMYGKNIPVDGLTEIIDMDGVATRIIPKAYNGYVLPGNEPWIDSLLINTYPTILTKVVEFENIRLASDVEATEDTTGLTICKTMNELYTALRKAVAEEIEAGIDKPKVSIEAEVINLAQTVEYADYKELEKVSLGDTVHLKHNKLGIVSDARVVQIEYDAVRDAVSQVAIGELQPSFMDRVGSVVQATEKALTKEGTVKASQVQGLLDGAVTQLRAQSTVAQRQEVLAILFEDLNPESPTYGATGIGTQGWMISRQRSADGTGWVWSTMATSQGIIADAIKSGTIQSVDISGVNIYGSNISGTKVFSEYFADPVRRTAALEEGNFVLQRTNSTNPAVNTEFIINGNGAGFSTPNALVPARAEMTTSFRASSLSDTAQYSQMNFSGLNIYSSATQYLNATSDRVRVMNGATQLWTSNYKAGDKVELGIAAYAAYITNSNKRIQFFIPTTGTPTGRTATISLGTTISGYTPLGQLNSASTISTTGWTTTCYCRAHGVGVRIDATNAFTNVNNNTSLVITGNFTLTFA